jgi:uncharacterized membrane protein YkvA (DUF1232 family)
LSGVGSLGRAAARDILVLWYACRNPATPLHLKLLALLAALYFVSPLDLIPDWFVLLGLADDITLLAFGIPLLLKLMPTAQLQQARAEADGLLARMRIGRS